MHMCLLDSIYLGRAFEKEGRKHFPIIKENRIGKMEIETKWRNLALLSWILNSDRINHTAKEWGEKNGCTKEIEKSNSIVCLYWIMVIDTHHRIMILDFKFIVNAIEIVVYHAISKYICILYTLLQVFKKFSTTFSKLTEIML